MDARHFFLAGDAQSSGIQIDISNAQDLESLNISLAGAYAIVDPAGIGFQAEGRQLLTLDDIKQTTGPISITINGHPVRDVPGPKGMPFLGSYLEVYPDHLGNNRRYFEKYGPLFQTTTMGMTQIQCNDPDLAAIALNESQFFSKIISNNPNHPLHAIHNPLSGVFTSDTDNPAWKLVHKFLPPALGPKAVRHYAPVMNETVDGAWPVFDELEQSNEAWNVYQYMLKLGSQAIGKLVLDMNFGHFDSIDAPLHGMVMAMAEMLSINKKISSRGPWYASLPFGDPEKLRQIHKYIETNLDAAIGRARSSGTEDLPLQDAALHSANIIDYLARATDNNGNKLPRGNLIGAVTVSYGAGFTTTSTLLSWLIHGMVTYPDIQEKLVQELVDHDFADGQDVTPDIIEKMEYLDKYIKEVQRVHNPSYQPGRTARIDCILPGGYRIRKDDVIIPALHHIHNNPKYWDNPERFDTERWETPQVINRHKYQYIPFAAGQRMCIGFNFALQEAKIFLLKLVWRYQWYKEGESAVEYDPFFQLIRPVNLYVHTKRRSDYPSKSTSVQS